MLQKNDIIFFQKEFNKQLTENLNQSSQKDLMRLINIVHGLFDLINTIEDKWYNYSIVVHDQRLPSFVLNDLKKIKEKGYKILESKDFNEILEYINNTHITISFLYLDFTKQGLSIDNRGKDNRSIMKDMAQYFNF